MQAYKCDRCKEFFVGAPITSTIEEPHPAAAVGSHTGSKFTRKDLCFNCTEAVKLFMAQPTKWYYKVD